MNSLPLLITPEHAALARRLLPDVCVAGGLPLAGFAAGVRALAVVRALRAHLAADAALLDADFPEEVMSGKGYMVGYAEIFPLGSAFPFRIEKGSWLADDQYCVNPGCRCPEVLLSFIRLRDEAGPTGDIAGDGLRYRERR